MKLQVLKNRYNPNQQEMPDIARLGCLESFVIRESINPRTTSVANQICQGDLPVRALDAEYNFNEFVYLNQKLSKMIFNACYIKLEHLNHGN